MRQLILSVLLILLYAEVQAGSFFVSSNANAAGDGSFSNPWQLQTALNHPATLQPGDTVWIKGGTYTNSFDAQTSFACFTNGQEGAPIIFRNYNHERVVLDGNLENTLYLGLGKCSYTWFWGIEVSNSYSTNRTTTTMGGVNCSAENIRFINMIVHDTGSGIDTWKTAHNSETYGCIIYYIGNDDSNGSGHGHGMYLQNDTSAVRNISNNIVFSTFSYGMKVWQTTNTAPLGKFNIERNIIFNGGEASVNTGNATRTHNFFIVPNNYQNIKSVSASSSGKAIFHLDPAVTAQNEWPVGTNIIGTGFTGAAVAYNLPQKIIATDPLKKWFETDLDFLTGATSGGSMVRPATDMVIRHNYTYSGNKLARPPVNAFGLNSGMIDMVLDSNVLTGQTRIGPMNLIIGENTSVRGNKIISGIPPAYVYYLWGFNESVFPENEYYPDLPTGLDYYVLPNKYEAGRANIAIYNWDSVATVQIDVSAAGLQKGDEYELVNVMDYHNDIIKGKMPSDGIISVPMTGHTSAEVVGSSKPVVSQFPQFGAFVLRKSGNATTGTKASSEDESETVRIYPNPVQAELNVSLRLPKPMNVQLSLTDLTGRLIYSKAIGGSVQWIQTTLDIQDVPAGMYVLNIRTETKVVSRKVVICKH